jgi:sugar lactone lactonase YvrE
LIAFDVFNKTIKWRFGSGSTQWSLVDSDGNIYVTASVDSINNGNITLYSLNPNSKIRWYKELKGMITQPTIDKNGNIFFVSDSIYSIDYNGNIRWSKKFETDGFVTTPLVSDIAGNIYVIKEQHQKFELTAFNNNGTVLYSIPNLEQYPGQSPAIGFNRLYIPAGKGEIIHSIK